MPDECGEEESSKPSKMRILRTPRSEAKSNPKVVGLIRAPATKIKVSRSTYFFCLNYKMSFACSLKLYMLKYSIGVL